MISKMEHVAILVKDLEQSIQFYLEIFGFKVRLRGSKPDKEMAFLFLESQPSMEIELIQEMNPASDFSENGIVNHLAFTVEDIDRTINYLKGKNIRFTSDEINSTLEGGRMILFRGPNQELLQLVERLKNKQKD